MGKGSAGAKKEDFQKPDASSAPVKCVASGCKTMGARFGFCDEHYDHFKFGLIKKTGEPVPDYEKKFEHYRAYKAKRAAQKAA